MSDHNHIKNYSASDIEKYWQGRLSPAEMHALEKAALDDPFLADALEGFQYADPAHRNWLKEKLSERTGAGTKVIPLTERRFMWMKVAVAVLIIGGMGVLASRFFFNDRNNSLATAPLKDSVQENKNNPPVSAAETDTSAFLSPTADDSSNPGSKNNAAAVITNPAVNKISTKDSAYPVAAIPSISKENKDKPDPSGTKTALPKNESSQDQVVTLQKQTDDSRGAVLNKEKSKETDNNSLAEKKEVAAGNQGYISANKKTGLIPLNNVYNGRVTDIQKNPVPFANVMSTRDRVGTYTDIKGNFNLVSSDSVLEVQIRSLGFETDVYRLTPENSVNNLVMKEDESARKNIVAENRKVVGSRARTENRTLEEPEPEIGWGYYDTYVINNLNISDEIRSRNSGGEVELSFQVDNTGNPTNIRVTRSVCKECDEEAIRLLKQGPRWKKTGKKSRTTVTIPIE